MGISMIGPLPRLTRGCARRTRSSALGAFNRICSGRESARSLIKETVDARYGETNEEKLAREYLSRKRIPKPESPEGTARVMRRLVAAGFSTGTIYKVLRRWDVPEEELAALENVDTEPHEE